MKILIIDDSRAMRLLITRALRQMDLPSPTYLEAADGNQALQAIENQRPELVISDFNIPGLSGMDVLRTVKAGGIDTCFGFITSEASSLFRAEAKEAGARFVITKPFTVGDLSHTLRSVLADLGVRAIETDDESSARFTNTATTFPTLQQIAELLRELLRRSVTASQAPSLTTSIPTGHLVAEYRRVNDGSVVACGIADIACAVRMGSALTLIPAKAAAEAVTSRRVDEIVAGNFNEILSVMSRLFDGGDDSRVRLGQVHQPGEKLSPELSARIAKPAGRIDACVAIDGYGTGNIALCSLR